MLIHSDFHIHSEYSYDANLPLATIAEGAKACDFVRVGISDHLNFNDPPFIGNIRDSAAGVKEAQKKYPFMILGVELTPIQKGHFDYIAKNGTRDGYVLTADSDRYGIEFGLSKAELMEHGVRYGVGASHWRIDTIGTDEGDGDADSLMRELFRQQMWIAQDERVTILGHPWYHGKAPWYADVSMIPRSMNEELAAALKENGKCVECNTGVMLRFEEKARYQYAELLREMFEKGLRITFGSDSHGAYNDNRMGTGRGDLLIEKYLLAAGFKDGDFYTLQDIDLW